MRVFIDRTDIVRVSVTSMVTVRNEQVTIYGEDGFDRVHLADAALIRFIAGDLGLAALPVEDAVAPWRAATEDRA